MLQKMDFALGGGGAEVKTGTYTTTAANQVNDINTGISNLKGFLVWGLQDTTRNIQFFIRWESSLGNYYYAGAAYSSGGTYANMAFSSTSNAYAPSIVSITNGVVELKNMSSMTNWGNTTINWIWYAW